MPHHARIIRFAMVILDPIDHVTFVRRPPRMRSPTRPMLQRPFRHAGENHRLVTVPNNPRIEYADHFEIRVTRPHVLRPQHQVGSKSFDHGT